MFDQVIGTLMGTNCVPLLVVLFLYESDILGNLIRRGYRRIARSFNFFAGIWMTKKFIKRMSKCNDNIQNS